MRFAIALAVWLLPATALAQHEGHGPAPKAAPAGGEQDGKPGEVPPSYAEVTLSPERVQLIGLRTAPAQRATLAGTVRAPAVIAADEARLVHVHTKLMGWVQELYVSTVGARVKKGQPLYSLYSQDLYAAQAEYLRALRTAPELAAAAKQRLRLWDVPPDQISRIEREGPQKAIVFRAPASGVVLEKAVVAGHFVEAEMMLFLLGDLSEVWVLADVYEYEVSRLDPGATAELEVQGLPGRLEARVDYVYPTVDPRTRTVRVRLVAGNPAGELRPGAFATAHLPTRAAEATWVPDEAVIDTGTRKVVFLAPGGGRFRPVEVRTGRRAAGRTEIVAGVAPGEQVVVSAQFLLDGESRLRGGGPGPGHGGH